VFFFFFFKSRKIIINTEEGRYKNEVGGEGFLHSVVWLLLLLLFYEVM